MKLHSAMRWVAASVLLVASAAQAETIKLSALPAAAVSKPPPKKKVHHVSGRADGFFVKRRAPHYVTIATTQEDLDENGNVSSAACLSLDTVSFGDPAFGSNLPITSTMEWSPQTQSTAAIANQPPLRVFHREEVVVVGTGATLETRDAIVDGASVGAKTIDKRSLPLAKVGSAAAGVTVYAFRETDQVQFVVVVAEESVGQPAMIEAQLPGPMQQTAMASQCRHLRVPLAVKDGEGSATSVLLRVVEPERANAPAKEDANGIVQRTMRTLAVHLSTSWLSGDAEPIVSVTSGWQGPAVKTHVAKSSLRRRF